MTSIKQDIFNDNTLLEYYLNFTNYSVEGNSIRFESRFSTFYKKPIEYIDEKILGALSHFKQEHISVLRSRFVYNRNLQDIADEVGITRERVRQIEVQTIKKMLVTIDKSLITNIINILSSTPIIFLDDIPIKDQELKILFCEFLSYKKSRKALFDRDLMCLVKDHNFSLTGLLNRIENHILKSSESVFSKDSLINTLQLLLPNVKNIEKLIPIFRRNNKLRIVDNEKYFFPFLYPNKTPKIDFLFSTFSNGIEVHKQIKFIRDELDKYFPGDFNSKDRTIATAVNNSKNIVLWGWGEYIHIKYVSSIIEEYDFSTIINYLDEHLGDTQIDLESCFEVFKDELTQMGIENKYALHSCLKLKYPDDYSYQDSPWISKAGTERRELRETLKNLLSKNRIYSLDELVDLMHTNKVRVQQLIDNTEEIIQIRPFEYMKKNFLAITEELLKEIIYFANMKVKEFGFIYIDLIVDKYAEELSKFIQYDLRLILLELLKKTSLETKFNVSNTRIIGKDYPITKDSLNFHILIENLMKDRKTISIDDIANYFVERGLSKDRIMMYYLYSKIKKIVRIDQETFINIKKLGLSSKDVDDINLVLDQELVDETKIDDIIHGYKLPQIATKWNRYILTDILDHEKFAFSPSRENPIYISKKS